MKTRILETKKFIKKCIYSVNLLEQEANSLIFDAQGGSMAITRLSEELGGAITERKTLDKFEGKLKIDFLTDSIMRIRYKENTQVDENINPMVVGTFSGPKKLVVQKSEENVTINTSKIEVIISLKPFRIEIFNEKNTRIGIGGPERNYFGTWDAFSTGTCLDNTEGTVIAVESFDLEPDEAIYGFGEKFSKLNKVGQTVDLLMQEGLGTFTTRTYKNIPFFLSTKGYGIFFNHSSPITCWIGSICSTNIQAGIQDEFLDYYVILGDIKEILSQYTDITGKGTLPPKWSFGYWQSKISYESAEESLEVARMLRENKIPADVLHLDTFWFKENWYCDLKFSEERFPNPQNFINEMAQLGFKISLWQLPYIPEGSEYYQELKDADAFVKDENGTIIDTGIIFTKEKRIAPCIDFTNPKGVEIYQKHIGKLLKMGIKAIKVDFGEEAPIKGVYHDGTPGHQAHNLYPLLYNRTASEITRIVHGNGFIWARSAWAGSQRYPCHWGGDNSTNFASMIPQLRGGLSFGLSGFQFWSEDIGGFLGSTGGDLLIRWMQMGVFHSHSRIHGSGIRELYRFDKPIVDICREFINLRYRLIPYIYGSAMKSVKDSLPMTRALVIEFQKDKNVWDIDNEYLFGESLLIAPITQIKDRKLETQFERNLIWRGTSETEGERNSIKKGQNVVLDLKNKTIRSLYLPKGVWTDWWTNKRIQGEKWITVEVPISEIPIFIREGSIIPLGPVKQYIDEFETKQIELRISLFEEDGNSEFIVPVNDEEVKVIYTALNGLHKVVIEKSKVKFAVEAIGDNDLIIIQE